MTETTLQREKLIMLREHLKARGIVDPRLIDAMSRIPREQFVGKSLESQAYADAALPIGCGRSITISRCRPLCFSSTSDGAVASPR